MSHPLVPKERGGPPWEVMEPPVGLGDLILSPVFFNPKVPGRGLLQGKLPSAQLSLFPATPNMESDLGKGLES